MHIQRIQVPNFRVLQNVDITFEKEFMPRIFPLGSENGGGKSTLLQLVFILLHCSAHENRKEYIQNLLEDFDVPEGETTRELAKFEIWDGEKTVELAFSVCNDDFLNDLSKVYNEEFSFVDLAIVSLSKKFEYIKNNQEMVDVDPSMRKRFMAAKRILEYLQNYGLLFITYYSDSLSEYNILVCSTSNHNKKEDSDIESMLLEISSQVHLAAPSSHVYLFFTQKNRQALFVQNAWNEYINQLLKAKEKLPNFFIHNFLLVDALLKTFQYARDKDFKQAIETNNYGNYYINVLKDLSYLLGNKKITPSPELDRIIVKQETPQGEMELGPEDLSHGEIKKLSIYVWLKYIIGENAIVLVDEIENTLHPDWQYQMVDNLKEWGPNNQYILATHSYDVCQALTPAHVKELEPKLLKNNP